MAGENKIRPKGFKAWIENYWYHYKWHTIVAVMLIITVSVSLVQCAVKPSYDYYVVLAVQSVEFVPSQVESLENQLAKYGSDQNGDGEVTVMVVDCSYDQEKTAYAMALSKRQKLQSIITGEQDMLVILSDKECFDWLDGIREEGFMENMGLPEGNGRYFSLTDTELYSNAKADVDPNLVWPTELRLSRRIVKGTLIENDKNIEKSVKKADDFIFTVMKKNS